jgi:rod shape-determining protein MreD
MNLAAARGLCHPARWLGVPGLLAVLAATIVFAAPIRIFGLQLPEPVFAMVPAFAWAADPAVDPGAVRPAPAGPVPRPVLGRADRPVGLSLLVAYGWCGCRAT